MSGVRIFRLAGILLAAVSLVLLSVPALELQYTDVFQGMLDWLEESVGKYFEPLEGLLKLLAAYVGLDLHLQKHWHYTFVLMWLLNGSIERALSREKSWPMWVIYMGWGGLCALVSGAATGSVPLDSGAIVLFAGAGFLAFMGVSVMFDNFDPTAGRLSFFFFFAFALVVFVLVAGVTYAGIFLSTPMKVGVFPSPGLLIVAATVAYFGVLFLVTGLFVAGTSYLFGKDNLWLLSSNKGFFGAGLDIVGSFGIAIFLAIMGLYLPG